MAYYPNDPRSTTHGNFGVYVDRADGVIRNVGGQTVDVRPRMDQRNVRRVLVRTDQIRKNADGTYVAEIRHARGVVGVALTYASIPRNMRSSIAQLVLYSVPIKADLSNAASDLRTAVLQRLSRTTLLSHDMADYPFFPPGDVGTATSGRYKFDWQHGTSAGLWIQQTDRTTRVPPGSETPYANAHIDVDTLTVHIPYDVTTAELGQAFQNVLKTHTGTEMTKKNSLWTQFGIGVTDTGFTVHQDQDIASHYNTFAVFVPATRASTTQRDDPGNLSLGGDIMYANPNVVDGDNAADTFVPMYPPIKITLDASREAYVDYAYTTGTSPSDVSGSQRQTYSYPATANTSTGLYDINIDTANVPTVPVTGISSFSLPKDVQLENIKEVTTGHTYIASVTTVTNPSAESTSSFTVSMTNGTLQDVYNAHTNSPTNMRVYVSGLRSDLFKTWLIRVKEIEQQTNIIKLEKFDVATGSTTNILLDSADISQNYDSGTIILHIVDPTKTTAVTVSQIQRSYQRTRDIKLGLRWQGRKEGADFRIDGNHDYTVQTTTATAVSALRETTDVNGMATLDTTTDLKDTFVPSNGLETAMLPMHRLNDAHQADRMMFCGHMMNVAPPTEMDMTTSSLAKDAVKEAVGYLRPDDTTDADNFYLNGLGWKTSVVNHSTKYVMPAYPVRSGQAYTDTAIDISPLVARILNADTSDKSFYQPTDTNYSTNTPHKYEPKVNSANHNMKNAVVISIGGQNYTVQSARRISVLGNDSGYTLDMSGKADTPLAPSASAASYGLSLGRRWRADSHVSSSPSGVYHTAFPGDTSALAALLDARGWAPTLTEEECERFGLSGLRPHHSVYSSATSTYYRPDATNVVPMERALFEFKSGTTSNGNNGFVPTDEARYFTWCFELDREVSLPLPVRADTATRFGGAAFDSRSTPPTPPISPRTYHGLIDDATMLMPTAFMHDTGRPAPSAYQDAPHAFSVRAINSSLSAYQQPLMRLHNVGNIEFPVNDARSARQSADVFALLGTEIDQKKALLPCFPTATWFRTPTDMSSLQFSFVSQVDGDEYELTSPATLAFDLYCQNE
jgi:hypothetical protein